MGILEDCMTEEPDARLDAIAKLRGCGWNRSLSKASKAPDGYGYGAWVWAFDLGCKVGNGRTPEEAIEDLLGELESAERFKRWEEGTL
jgi:hypothetical protein